eukprot:626500-Rhodomonas_salina.3
MSASWHGSSGCLLSCPNQVIIRSDIALPGYCENVPNNASGCDVLGDARKAFPQPTPDLPRLACAVSGLGSQRVWQSARPPTSRPQTGNARKEWRRRPVSDTRGRACADGGGRGWRASGASAGGRGRGRRGTGDSAAAAQQRQPRRYRPPRPRR